MGKTKKEENIEILKKELHEREIQVELQKSELLEKQVELEESRDRFADLYDFAPNGYLTLDMHGIITETNYTAARMLGLDKSNLIDFPFVHFLLKDHFQKFLTGLRNCRQDNHQHVLELGLVSKNKPPITAHVILTPVRNYQSKEQNFRVSLTDITAEKKIENKLIESEERFRIMAESSPMMIWMSDMESNIIYANKTKLKFLKRSFDEIKDKGWVETIHPEDRQKFFEVIHKAYEEEGSFSDEVRVDCKDEQRWVVISATPRILKNGRMIGFIGTEMDITERVKSRMELEGSLKEKEILLKEIHHRIKNNLQIISSLLNLQLNYLDNEEIIEMLKSSQSRIRSMAMIHEKLYKTKELSNINFGEYIRDFTTYLFNAYRSRIGNLRLDLDLCDVKLDINLSISLGLILNELITNALKHAFPNNKPGRLGITLREENGQIHLCITDNGVGLPENFDIKKTNSLGLELVDSLVEQHRGTLEIKSNGKTEIEITLQKVTKTSKAKIQ